MCDDIVTQHSTQTDLKAFYHQTLFNKIQIFLEYHHPLLSPRQWEIETEKSQIRQIVSFSFAEYSPRGSSLTDSDIELFGKNPRPLRCE